MNLYNVLSVDPSRLTLGALHPEAAKRILRSNVISRSREKCGKLSLLNMFFACLAPGIGRFGGYMLLFRVLFASLLAVAGALILTGDYEVSHIIFPVKEFAVFLLTVSAMIAIGFLTRIASATSTAVFAIISIGTAATGAFDMQAWLSLFGCMLFLYLGAGRYSVDFIIRKTLITSAIIKKQKNKKQRLSYKAYHVASKC